VDKYKLPPNDPRFESRSWVDWQVEMFEDLYVRRETIKAQMAEGTADNTKATKALQAIEAVLGIGSGADDTLVDRWEKDLEEGRVPDLNAEG